MWESDEYEVCEVCGMAFSAPDDETTECEDCLGSNHQEVDYFIDHVDDVEPVYVSADTDPTY